VAQLTHELNLAHPPSNPQVKAHYTNLAAISALLSGIKDNPPPLTSDLEHAELEYLSTTRHPLSRYENLRLAGDLSMERLLAILRNPHLALQSVIDTMATNHSIPASYVAMKLMKLPDPDRTLVDKWMAMVPKPFETIEKYKTAAILRDRVPYIPSLEVPNERLFMDLAAHMSYGLKYEPLRRTFKQWKKWKLQLDPSFPRICFSGEHRTDHADIMFIPTILLLRATSTLPLWTIKSLILQYILHWTRLPPKSRQTRDIFKRLLQPDLWVSDPVLISFVLDAITVYRPSLEFAEQVRLVVAELLKRPSLLHNQRLRRTVKTVLKWALEDCGVGSFNVRLSDIVRERRQERGQNIKGEGFLAGLDMEHWCPLY